MNGRKNDPLRKADPQYSLFKFILKFAAQTGRRPQVTRYSWDFDSERKRFLPGLDLESRRYWWNLLCADPIANEPDLYEILAQFRPHYNSSENVLYIWFPPTHQTHFQTAWGAFKPNLDECTELLNLEALKPRMLSETENARQIRLLGRSTSDEMIEKLNAYQKLAVYYGEAIREGKITGIDIYDNLNYTPDNYIGMMDSNNLPGVPKPVDETPQSDLKSRNSTPETAGRIIENAFGRAV